MKRWPMKSLGEVLEISRERIEPSEHPNRCFNYVGLESIEGHSGNLLPYQATPGAEIRSTKNVFHPNEILYGKLRPYLNKVHLAGAEGICSTDIYVLRARQQRMHPSFAAYYLRSPYVLSVASNAMAGANLPRIGQDSLLAIPAPVPPLAEQERIVRLLDEGDELRKLRAQADTRTAKLLPALFHEMFGDPAENERGLPVKSLAKLCRNITDIDHKMPKAVGSGVPFISAKDLADDGSISFRDVKKISEDDFRRLSRKSKPQRGDIIYSRIGARLGKARMVEVDFDFLASYSCCTIKPNTDVVDAVYLCHLLDSPSMLKQAHKGIRAIAVPDLGMGEIKDFQILFPPLPLQVEFAQRAKEIRELEAAQAASRQRTEDLFQSMLHRAFNGEL